MTDGKCNFTKAWVGYCDKPSPCPDHAHLRCVSCDNPATHECDSTIGPLVCGMPLCAECEHSLVEDGTTGWQFEHCRIGEQKHTPWYARGAT